MATPVPFGDEFLINSTTTGNQDQPVITALTDGRFVAVWRDLSQTGGDTSAHAVRGQLFNADGIKSGGEFLVNTTTFNGQFDPTVTALNGGGFVVAWTDFASGGGDASPTAVRAQVFNAGGSKFGGEFLVNTTTASLQEEPSIATLADGRFVVAWTDWSETGGDTTDEAIRAQIFSPDGTKSGAEFLVNTTTTNFQDMPAVTGLADGRFVVAWRDFSQTGGDTSNLAVRAQVFNANGTKSGTEFLVNTTTTGGQNVPAITALADGRFVAVWQDSSLTGGDTSGTAVRGQIFNANGTKSGGEFLVNTTTADDQLNAVVAALPDGRFVVAWQDESATGGDTSDTAVRAQVFNADGTKSGAEFLVNTTTPGFQSLPAITVLADGRFVIGWTDFSATGDDTDGTAVRGQIFDPREEGVILEGTPQDDRFEGTGFDDSISGAGGNDFINAGDGNDMLFGLAGDDILIGLGGDDTLNGGDGGDQVFGGSGNDTIVAGSGAGDDFYIGGPDTDTVTYASTTQGVVVNLSTGQATGAEIGTDQIFEIENATGGGGNDQIIGDTGNNVLSGLGGNDILTGDSGADTLNGGDDDDTLTGGIGADILNGGDGNDTIQVAAGIEGLGDTYAGGDGTDTLEVTGAGAVTLDGFNAPAASIEQWQGNGSGLFGTASANVFNFSNLTVKTGLPFVDGASGNDQITGSQFGDNLLGSAGNDTLRGGLGDDVLTGGAGRDILFGDAGLDVFDYNALSESRKGGTRDIISQFTRGQDDIDLRTIDAKTGIAGNQKFKFIGKQDFHDVKGELRYKDLGSKVIVQGDVNGDGKADFEIFVKVGAMSAGDFLL